MRTYNYTDKWQKLLTPEIVGLLTSIHEYKGEQTLFIETKPDVLTHLLEIAKMQSTEASNKIEGIYTSDDRIKKLVSEKTMPRTRSEQEIAGYRDVLTTIHESHDYIQPRPSIILQLHKNLYKYTGIEGGRYKNSDNVITEEINGEKHIRFKPVDAFGTPSAIEDICKAYEEALSDEKIDPLLIIPMFILDFLSIHPFNDGNGRMGRLLTLLLLYRSGYIVGKYISIEKLIEQTKETYYDALKSSSQNWHEEANDYIPFVQYTLGVIVAAYKDFSARTKVLNLSGSSKSDRVRAVIRENIGNITKSEIIKQCPDISKITVERALKEMIDNNEIIKIGGGRYTSYVWNWEEEK